MVKPHTERKMEMTACGRCGGVWLPPAALVPLPENKGCCSGFHHFQMPAPEMTPGAVHTDVTKPGISGGKSAVDELSGCRDPVFMSISSVIKYEQREEVNINMLHPPPIGTERNSHKSKHQLFFQKGKQFLVSEKDQSGLSSLKPSVTTISAVRHQGTDRAP